jgi:hypothetical protein
VTAILVVAMLSMYAHSKGDQMATEMPQRPSLSSLRGQTLSRDLAEFLHGGDKVRVRVVGDVTDMEGYPPLPEELRAELRTTDLTFPADLRLDELEARAAETLRTKHDLGDVSVSIDERGRATVSAAPPFSGLSKRVGSGRHAVSVAGLLPTGLARGDEVTVITPDAQVRGTVLSAKTDGAKQTDDQRHDTAPELDEDDSATPVRAPTTDGGEGRLTVAVTRTDVQPLLRASDVKIVVESRGTRREYEAVSLLRRAGRHVRRLAVRPDGPLDGIQIGPARLPETEGITVLAVKSADGWLVAPDGTTTLEAGDELFAVGTRDSLTALAGGTP